MEKRRERMWVAVEFYIGAQVLSGYLAIATGRRLLDMLNGLGDLDRDVQSGYIEFKAATGSGSDEPGEARYVRKTSVALAAIAEPNLARGAGERVPPPIYPQVEKSPVRVSLEMRDYSLDATMHCAPGRTVRDVLDEKTLFLPLTEVTITRNNQPYVTRPFVAARKEQLISLKELTPGEAAPGE